MDYYIFIFLLPSFNSIDSLVKLFYGISTMGGYSMPEPEYIYIYVCVCVCGCTCDL